MEQPKYVLAIRPLPDPTDVDGIRRLRAMLKSMLRGYRLRVVSCVEWKETELAKAMEPTTDTKQPARRKRRTPETAIPGDQAAQYDIRADQTPKRSRGLARQPK